MNNKIFWWALGSALVVGVIFLVGTLETERARENEDWNVWCHSQEGEIREWKKVPIDQLGSPIRSWYCVTDDGVIGAR